LDNITKIVSASDPQTLELLVTDLRHHRQGRHLQDILHQGRRSGQKVIENTQRDINIALMNELSIIFNRMDIDTLEVRSGRDQMELPPLPTGLVGAIASASIHYLTYKAESIGYHPEMILAGRRINDNMGNISPSARSKS